MAVRAVAAMSLLVITVVGTEQPVVRPADVSLLQNMKFIVKTRHTVVTPLDSYWWAQQSDIKVIRETLSRVDVLHQQKSKLLISLFTCELRRSTARVLRIQKVRAYNGKWTHLQTLRCCNAPTVGSEPGGAVARGGQPWKGAQWGVSPVEGGPWQGTGVVGGGLHDNDDTCMTPLADSTYSRTRPKKKKKKKIHLETI